MTYGANYWCTTYVNPYHAQQQREREAKVKREDQQLWDIAIANLEARMRYNNEHQA